MKRSALRVGLVAIVAGLIQVGAPSSDAEAYNLWFCKFGSTTVRYYVAVNSPSTDIAGAATAWTSAQGDVSLIAGTSSNYNMTATSYDFGNSGWTGLTYRRGNISLAPQCSNGKWVDKSPVISVNAYYNSTKPTVRRGTAVHEFGHALGLAHNDATAPCAAGGARAVSIMHSTTFKYTSLCPIYTPQTDDISGVKAIY